MTAKTEKSVDPTALASEDTHLRDMFAMAALAGILASYRNGRMPQGGFVTIAAGAYLAADAALQIRAGTIDVLSALKAEVSPLKEDED